MAKGNKRKEFNGNSYYHIYNRGLGKNTIFHNDREFKKFYELITKYSGIFKSIKIISYSLLSSHFHFVVYNKEEGYNLSDFMKRLQGAYATWFRILHPTEFKQPVFEGRFKAKLIESEEYFHKCLAYVNFNAIKHDIVTDINDYEWTSYHQLGNKDKIEKYIDVDLDDLEF